MTQKPAITETYLEDWHGSTWADIQSAFRMEEREPEEVLIARYTCDGYDGNATVLYRNGADYHYVRGSHCSCFGLEGQWDPEVYSLETLIAALERSDGCSYSFCGEEGQTLLPMLRTRLTRRNARRRARDRALSRAA